MTRCDPEAAPRAGRGELLGSVWFWSLGLVLFEPLTPAYPREGSQQQMRAQPLGMACCRAQCPSQQTQGGLSSEPGSLLREWELQSVQLSPPTPLCSCGCFLDPCVSLWGHSLSAGGAVLGGCTPTQVGLWAGLWPSLHVQQLIVTCHLRVQVCDSTAQAHSTFLAPISIPWLCSLFPLHMLTLSASKPSAMGTGCAPQLWGTQGHVGLTEAGRPPRLKVETSGPR